MDTNTATLPEAEATSSAPDRGTLIKVPVTKGKGFVEVWTGELPDAVYQEILAQGLKVLVNRGTTKITKETYPDADELKAAAMAKAEEQVAALKSGKIRIVGAKSTKISGAVMTEARRLARNLVKDEIKRQGLKISHFDAKEITASANALIAARPEIVEQAQASIAARDAEAASVASAINVKAIPVSEKKIKALEDAKAAKGTILSAAKAGKIGTRQKPTQATA